MPRKSNFVGKILRSRVKENPRRQKSGGQKSFQIILDNPGITFEEFIIKGGRAKDITEDLKRNRITATNATK